MSKNRDAAKLEEIPQRRPVETRLEICNSAHILTEHSFRVTQDKIIDRLVKRNEEKLINSIVYDAFGDVKFKNVDTSNNEKIVKKSLSHRPKLNSLFATKGVITRKKKLKKVNLERIFSNHTSWSIKEKKRKSKK